MVLHMRKGGLGVVILREIVAVRALIRDLFT